MDRWMNGQMTNKRMGGSIDRQMDRGMNEWMNGQMIHKRKEKMDGWMNRQME